MKFAAKDFLESAKRELKYWEEGLKKILTGDFQYDNSMPGECVNALYKHKVESCKSAIEYLNTLDPDMIIRNNSSVTEECTEYYRLINS